MWTILGGPPASGVGVDVPGLVSSLTQPETLSLGGMTAEAKKNIESVDCVIGPASCLIPFRPLRSRQQRWGDASLPRGRVGFPRSSRSTSGGVVTPGDAKTPTALMALDRHPRASSGPTPPSVPRAILTAALCCQHRARVLLTVSLGQPSIELSLSNAVPAQRISRTRVDGWSALKQPPSTRHEIPVHAGCLLRGERPRVLLGELSARCRQPVNRTCSLRHQRVPLTSRALTNAAWDCKTSRAAG